MDFKNLHQQDKPLLMANVWDAPSAKTAEKLGFQAVGTSSSAIASLLGYRDGEAMKFSEMAYMVQRIKASTTLPVSVDLESGYGHTTEEIVTHIASLAALGVVGINIEDSRVGQERLLVDATSFATQLSAIKKSLERKNIAIFINVRIDTFILLKETPLPATKARITQYEAAGANGIFLPCIEKESDIKAVVAATDLPLNVMCMPKLPDFDALASWGVKRISMGNFLFDAMYRQLEQITRNVRDQNTFNSLF